MPAPASAHAAHAAALQKWISLWEILLSDDEPIEPVSDPNLTAEAAVSEMDTAVAEPR